MFSPTVDCTRATAAFKFNNIFDSFPIRRMATSVVKRVNVCFPVYRLYSIAARAEFIVQHTTRVWCARRAAAHEKPQRLLLVWFPNARTHVNIALRILFTGNNDCSLSVGVCVHVNVCAVYACLYGYFKIFLHGSCAR